MSPSLVLTGSRCTCSLSMRLYSLSLACSRDLAASGQLNTVQRLPSQHHQIRLKSSRRRMAKSLRLPPAPSFARPSSPYDHIIFNPPSSAPNVYHTPAKFLPASDPRRKLYIDAAAAASTSANGLSPVARPSGRSVTSLPPHEDIQTDGSDGQGQAIVDGKLALPPAVRPVREKKYHLTEEQVQEMRELRAKDPRRWTIASLAERFGCSEFFVQIVAKNAKAGQARREEIERIKKLWGPRKIKARSDRIRRKEAWGREL